MEMHLLKIVMYLLPDSNASNKFTIYDVVMFH